MADGGCRLRLGCGLSTVFCRSVGFLVGHCGGQACGNMQHIAYVPSRGNLEGMGLTARMSPYPPGLVCSALI